MSELISQEDPPSKILANCQMKLSEMDLKLSEIKSRCGPGKTKQKYSLYTSDDLIVLKKETDSLQGDIQYVKTLLDDNPEGSSSLPVRMMKKIFPSRVFSSQDKPASNGIKAKILAHSTAILEEKVKDLDTVARKKKMKKRRPKQESRVSAASDTSGLSSKAPVSCKAGASSDSEVMAIPDEMSNFQVISSPRCERPYLGPANIQVCSSQVSKYFFPVHSLMSPTSEIKESKTGHNFTTTSERGVQTVETFFKNVESQSKHVQTETPLTAWPLCAGKKYSDRQTYTEMDSKGDAPEGSKPNDILSQLQKNVLDTNEMDAVISGLLCNPLEVLQCKHVNRLCGSGFVNLIIRPSDFFTPVIRRGNAKRSFCKSLVSFENTFCIPYTYCVRETTSLITYKRNEMNEFSTDELKFFHLPMLNESSTSSIINKDENYIQCNHSEISITSCMSNSLQIDYKNHQTSGRIVLRAFGNSQSATQFEMLSRILSHLTGLPDYQEKHDFIT